MAKTRDVVSREAEEYYQSCWPNVEDELFKRVIIQAFYAGAFITAGRVLHAVDNRDTALNEAFAMYLETSEHIDISMSEEFKAEADARTEAACKAFMKKRGS